VNNTKNKNTELQTALKSTTPEQSPIDDDRLVFCDHDAEEVARMRQELEDIQERDRDRLCHAGWVRVDLSDTNSYFCRPGAVT